MLVNQTKDNIGQFNTASLAQINYAEDYNKHAISDCTTLQKNAATLSLCYCALVQCIYSLASSFTCLQAATNRLTCVSSITERTNYTLPIGSPFVCIYPTTCEETT